MFSFAAIWEATKLLTGGFLKKITFKGVMIFLAVCLFAFSQYKLYDYGKSRQAATDKVTIDKQAGVIVGLNTDLKALRTSVSYWQDTAIVAQADFDKLQNVTLKKIQGDLDTANARAEDWKKKALTPKEIVKYVTVQSDSHCVIPAGFVQLFNRSIEETPSAANDSSAVPDGQTFDADTPTTLKLSELSGVLVFNNAEAVQRGRQLNAWITWYTTTKANWDKVQQIIKTNLPNVNQPNPPVVQSAKG